MIKESEDYVILLLDEKGNIQSQNNVAEKITGYKPHETVGKNFGIFYTKKDQKKGLPEKLVKDAAKNGNTIYEGWNVKKNGIRFWAKIVISGLYNNTGRLTGFYKTIRCRTAKSRADEFDQINLNALINNTRDLMWSVDKNYKLITSNNAFDEIVMLMAGKRITKGDNILANGFTEEGLKRYRKLYERAFAGETFKVTEHTSIPKEFWSELSFYPIRKKGEVIGTACYSHNITEQKLAVEKAEHNEKLYKALVENGRDAIVILSETGKPIYVSPSIEKVLGYTEEETMQMDVFSKTHIDDIIEVQKVMEQVIANPDRPIKGHTGRMLHKDGSWHWYEATVTNKLHDPAIKGIVDNFRDITERKLAEEKIKQISRLYAFISQINQTIVHVTNEKDLFKEVCRIAIDVGKFKMAWIGMVDTEHKMVSILESYGMLPEDIELFTDVKYEDKGPQDHAISTRDYYVCNNIEDGLEALRWKPYAAKNNLHSCMVLPIYKTGKIVGTFNLYTVEKNFFDEQEIKLIKEVTENISYTLDVFEKEKNKKEIEEKIMHSELSLRTAQKIAHFGSWDFDISTGKAIWSDEHCRIFGLSPEENIQTTESLIKFIHPEDLDFVLNKITEAKTLLKSVSFQHRIVRRDGTVRYLGTYIHVKLNSEGKPVGVYGVAHDITEQKKAEEKIINSNRLYAFISQINQMIVQVRDEEILFEKACSIAVDFGKLESAWISIPDRVNKKFKIVAHKNVPATDLEFFDNLVYDDNGITANILQTSKLYVINDFKEEAEDSSIKKYGLKKGFKSCIGLPIMKSGEIIAVYMLFASRVNLFDNEEVQLLKETTDDISFALDKMEKEAENKRMTNDILHRNKDLEQFSYMVSHNLRSPVAKISSLAEMLQTHDLDKEDATEWIDELCTSVKKLDGVIADLNEILQIKHKEDKKKEIVHFSELVRDIKISICSLIKNDIEIISSFSEIDEMRTIRSYLYSIFYNLISNSVKYRQAEIKPVIHIASKKLDNKIQIIFRDNGLGIDLEKRGKQVFGLYKRFHSHVAGKGMGLYMVKTQVELLGGQIAISSEVDKGTEFRIEFVTG